MLPLPPRSPSLLFFTFVFIVSNLFSVSVAKGRASTSSSAAISYTLDLHHPHPNQRVNAVSDSAGDVFLALKCTAAHFLHQLHSPTMSFFLFQFHCEGRQRGRWSCRKVVFARRERVIARSHICVAKMVDGESTFCSEAAYSFEVGGRRGELSSVYMNANSLRDGFYSLRLSLFVGGSSEPVASASREFMFYLQQERIVYRYLCRENH
jgi:hypothetical protein